ncbi:hypothetical protein C9J27_03420 [Photobacterium kishitanii]|uniref:TonB C-terminal domain-containing protein n=1 Tax=Photobacterium kishitanii TaxID=318456 RepID=A0A2T3KMR5_9GAMM|nr:hypothetical protein C9J27_03420 [Photobacterium kishitanii]
MAERRAAMKAAAEASRLEKARGNYESDIYNTLFSAWSLPYSRTSVKCSVELTLDRSGKILSHQFLNNCNDFYVYSIEEAIRKVKYFKRVESGIFRNTEVINFIDNVTSSSIG